MLAAYGWSDLAPAFAKGALDEATRQALLARLVALNAERAKEEADGTIRWLRPDYQAPDAAKSMPKQVQTSLGMEDTARAIVLRRNNVSGMPGVARYVRAGEAIGGGEGRPYWVAFWANAEGRGGSMKFAAAKYGEAGARRGAFAVRRRALADKYGTAK